MMGKCCLLIILISVLAVTQAEYKMKRLISPGGKHFIAFEGIRYKTKVATSIFRFSTDNITRTWPKNANKRINCMCVDPWTEKLFGRKYCLFLNIYTPNDFINKKLPVFIWIHGAAFSSFGAARTHIYDPSRFMDHEIVFVTINYRLDILGFANARGSNVTGNFGLDDQRMGIEWVMTHIHSFGGDPQRVTLGGHGAGAAHALFHLNRNDFTPGGQKIKRCIAISGTRYSPWATGGYLKTAPLDQIVDCAPITPRCLEKERRKYLLRASAAAMRYSENLWETMIWAFRPTIDGKYIKELPGIAVNKTNHDFELLLGLNRNEGDFIFAFARQRKWKNWKETLFDNFIKTFYSYLLKKNHHFPMLYYVYSEDINERLTQLTTDGWFLYPAIWEASVHTGPKQGFMFDFKSKLDLMNCRIPRKNERTSHGDELPYIFNVTGCPINPKDEWVAKKYVQMLVNFVIDGHPQLKNYTEDNVLFTITDHLLSPGLFVEFDPTMAGRMNSWDLFINKPTKIVKYVWDY